jgi:hypothetical protein
MKSLIKVVKTMSVKSKLAGNSINFLDHTYNDPGCQKLMQQMNEMNLEQLGIEGHDDPYHF